MNPPHQITAEILRLIASVSEKIGQINARLLDKPSPKLRKDNRIQTIHASLSIEGNTLTQEQITALVENKRIIGPTKDVQEVMNAIRVYDQLSSFDPNSSKSFLKAHGILMHNLIPDSGKFRNTGVGIMAGNRIAHLAPPADNVPHLMNELFGFLKTSKEIPLIKSCVFHYEMEFIHPFIDGNGRMGRLWQTLILMSDYPVFEFIPFENVIHQTQNEYYAALAQSDSSGSSTPFITYMLQVIDDALNQIVGVKSQIMSSEERLRYFIETALPYFSRKDYMSVFKDISSATASRDLKLGTDMGLFEKEGDKIKTKYWVLNRI
jgi:Fic family protein